MKKTLLLLSIFCRAQIYSQNIISTVAGNGIPGFSGDNGQATSAKLNLPSSVTFDAKGNMYIADSYNNSIRKVNSSGIITMVVGNGSAGFSGDGGMAISSTIFDPTGVTFDTSGNFYIADRSNNRIRKVDTSGIITTVAGNGIAGFSGDGGQATSAKLHDIFGIAIDSFGDLYIADRGNNRIRKVNSSGIITTVVGSGVAGFSGDGGQATLANLNAACGLTFDTSGNMYIADSNNNRIRKVNTSGIISTIAGNGTSGYNGDGGIATNAEMDFPTGVAMDVSGNLFINDYNNNCIRKINTSGIISTIAGNGTAGFNGDGGVSTLAELDIPEGISLDGAGNLYIADYFNMRIRKVTNVSGINSLTCCNTQIFMYPNPNNGTFILQINNEIKNGELILINSIGQKVYEQKISKGQNIITANKLAYGLCNYIILDEKSQIAVGKIILE